MSALYRLTVFLPHEDVVALNQSLNMLISQTPTNLEINESHYADPYRQGARIAISYRSLSDEDAIETARFSMAEFFPEHRAKVVTGYVAHERTVWRSDV